MIFVCEEMMLLDTLDRPLEDLRISVTDRCNLRCNYCMPLGEYEWIKKEEILTFEEIRRVAALFLQLGVGKIRITGGEPLLRRDLEILVSQLASLPGLRDLCLTTNGSLLAGRVSGLATSGLNRVNVSIDTLKPDKFERLTRRADLGKVIDGLMAAKAHGLKPVKINTVVIRGINEDEIPDLVGFARLHGFSLRFIEFMDVGNANEWKSEKLVPKNEILRLISSRFPLCESEKSRSNAPATEYQFSDGRGDVGIIASVTEPFCTGCTRARITADGRLVTCLFSERGKDLKCLLRSGAGDDALLDCIGTVWGKRSDHYSEERLEALQSGRGYSARDRKKIEMITLGG